MNENKLNPLLDAMSEIDDSIITNTKKTKKRPLLIIAAVAAVLMLIMGAAVASSRSGEVKVNGESVSDLNYTVQENVSLLTREEFLEMGAKITEDSGHYTKYELNALPSEILQIHNLPLLTSDNFNEKRSNVQVGYSYFDEEIGIGDIDLSYSLTNKTNGAAVDFAVIAILSEHVHYSMEFISLIGNNHRSEYNKVDYEFLTLNDGSQAMITPFGIRDGWYAYFTYNGLIYEIHVSDTDKEEMKQILTDLGVL